MNLSRQRFFGWSLVVAGLLIATFSHLIVFPGLERLLGIETLVGRENVVYHPDGGYVFTNPRAMALWVVTVAGVGLTIVSAGAAVLIRSRGKS